MSVIRWRTCFLHNESDLPEIESKELVGGEEAGRADSAFLFLDFGVARAERVERNSGRIVDKRVWLNIVIIRNEQRICLW